MARGDLSVIGPQATIPRRIAASATRFEYGEPIIQDSVTLSSGVASVNTFTLAAIDILVIGTDNFGGVALEGSEPKNSTSTLIAQTVTCACPVGYLGRIRGKVSTAGDIDTAAELLAIIQDLTDINYNATGAIDGGELYTINSVLDTPADTGAFQIVEGDTAKGTLDVIIDPRAYRIANTIA